MKRLLALGGLLAACRCSDPVIAQPPAPDGGAGRAVATQSSADASVTMFEQVPVSDTVLAMLEHRDGKCLWTRFDPVTGKRSEMPLPFSPCPESFAWSPDARSALVRVSGPVERLIRLDFATRAVVSTTFEGSPTFGIDENGQAWALTFDSAVPSDGGVFEWHGQTFPVPEDVEGLPGLAHAWRLGAKNEWEVVETKASNGEACDTPGEHVFDVEESFGPSNREEVFSYARELDGEDPMIGVLTKAAAGVRDSQGNPVDEAGWLRVDAAPDAYVNAQQVERHYTPPEVLALVNQGKPELLTSTSLRLQEHHALVGTRLYDLRTRKVIWEAAPGWSGAVYFWPAPASSD